ncbi:hypothetical protein TSAR_011080, partial [Trichomalopsis sarcophagae]
MKVVRLSCTASETTTATTTSEAAVVEYIASGRSPGRTRAHTEQQQQQQQQRRRLPYQLFSLCASSQERRSRAIAKTRLIRVLFSGFAAHGLYETAETPADN